MGISKYQEETSPGVFKDVYLVRVEAINKYTGKRTQRRRGGIASKPKAEILYRELWNECRNERSDIPSVKNFGELRDFYEINIVKRKRSAENLEGLSPATIENKLSSLKHVQDWHSNHLDLITPLFVKSQIESMIKTKKISTSMAYDLQKEIKCVFVFAREAGYFQTDPLAGLKNRRRPKRKKAALNHAEVEKLLSEAKKQEHEFFPIWLLTVTLGLRRSELAGLKWTDVDFENRLAHLCRQNLPKEGIVDHLKDKEDRSVAIPIYVMPFLKQFKLRANSEFVIQINDDRWEKGRQAAVLREFCKKIGIKEITHHQLRSTYITLMLTDGISLTTTMESVGHSRIATTNEYYVSSGAHLMGQTDKLKIKVPVVNEAQILPLERAAK